MLERETSIHPGPLPPPRPPEGVALLEKRLEPLLGTLAELPWKLAVEVRAEPAAAVFRVSAPGELWVPVVVGERTLQVVFRWPVAAPNAATIVAVAAMSTRAIAAGLDAEARAVRAARRAARGERIAVTRSLEVQLARAETAHARRERDEERRRYEDAERRVTERDQLTAASAMLASVAHDIRSPLTSLLCNLRALEEDLGHTAGADSIAIFSDTRLACELIEGVLGSVRTFASRGGAPGLVPLDDVILSATRLFRWHASRAGVTVVTRLEGNVIAWGTPGELCQIVLTLLCNAAEAAGKGGRVVVSTGRAGEQAVVRVSDDGPGIPAGEVHHIFLPFHSKKPEGLGLGLTVARSMAQRHAGDLVAIPTPKGQRGATLELRARTTPPSGSEPPPAD